MKTNHYVQRLCACGEEAPNKKSDLCPKCMEWKIRGRLDSNRKNAFAAERLRSLNRSKRI